MTRAEITTCVMCLVGMASVAWGQAPSKEAASAPAGAGLTVAVLDYEAQTPGNPTLGSQMAEILTARLSIEERLQLVERAKLGQVIEEQKLKLVGLVDQQQAVQVGKLLGAKLLVMGKAFEMDKKLMIVTKIVGVETGRVVGTIRQVELSKPISESIGMLGEDIAETLRTKGKQLLPADDKSSDPLEEIRTRLGDRERPKVAVVVPESHRLRVVVDPAVETEIKKTLLACGFKVVDAGRNDLADWAKAAMKDKDKPWPPALQDADFVVVGEAFSEFAVRTGDLVTCTARAEINLIDRQNGRILLADRYTARAVDLAEVTAGKTALQISGRHLGVEVCRTLADYRKPAAGAATSPSPATKPAPAEKGPVSGFFLPVDFDQRAWQDIVMIPGGEEAYQPTSAPKAKRTVFASPFDNATGQDQYEPSASGMADLVAVLLAQQEHIAVVERQRLAALTDEQARALKGLTGQEYAIKAGKLLTADTVLVGRLFLIQGKLTVNVKALDLVSERVLAAEEMSSRPEDIMEASLALARGLARQMSLPLPEIDLKQIDKSPIASLHFAQGLANYYAGNMDQAIMQFMRTIDLDPNYAEASYWAGMCYYRQGEWDHAAIEWDKFLKDQPGSRFAASAAKLLADAKAKEKASTVPRLGPDSHPASGPANGEGGAGK